MEMQQVRYFLAVARTLNFTRAAEECSISQPALTRAIKQLEDEFGGDLLRREGRLTHLTDLGERMQPILQQVYDSAIAAKLLAAKVRTGEVATLTLAVSRTLDIELLLPLLTELRRAFPALQFKLRRGSGPQVGELLKTGEADLALGGPIGETWERIEAWPMFAESFDLVVGAGHELAAHCGLDLEVELVRGRRLLVPADPDQAEFDIDRLAEAGAAVDQAHEFDCDRDLEALVAAGFGVAVLPASKFLSDRLRHVRCSGLELTRTVAIYAAAGRPRSREATALLNLARSTDWSARLQALQTLQ